jgi:hypothetical protein
MCRRARFEISIFTVAGAARRGPKVLRLARIRLRDRGVELAMQSRSLLVIEVITADGNDRFEWLQVHDLALGQVGGLVEHEAAVVYASLERFVVVRTADARRWHDQTVTLTRGHAGETVVRKAPDRRLD